MNALLIAALLAASPQATTPSANTAPITLEEARREGRQNTQALLSLLDLERAQQDIRLARAPLFPQLDLSVNAGGVAAGTQSIVTPVCDPTGTNCVQQEVEVPGSSRGNYGISLTLNQVIYDRARWKQLAQSGAVAEAQRGLSSDQEDASELEAINRFYSLYRSQATIQVLEATVRRSEEQLERARALFQAGRVGRGEELTALVNLGNDRIALMQRRGQLALDQSQLATWLARPGPQPLVAQDPGLRSMEVGPVPSLEAAIAEARRCVPRSWLRKLPDRPTTRGWWARAPTRAPVPPRARSSSSHACRIR
jgi:outer membrane protein TolC